MHSGEEQFTDLFIIGGGINGCGIARDAVGRGLTVRLAEMNDLASATSSASTKLFHGGLRYLEYFEFRLVREALIEREILLKNMPHISWPMRFVLPYHSAMRFDNDTPTSKLLGWGMPWMKGRRPAWLIRLGLFLYDHLGGRKILPGTTTLNLDGSKEGEPLQNLFAKAYEYSDCWVEDSRLVVLNARDATARGADIMVRTQVISARREGDCWCIKTRDTQTGEQQVFYARMLVNAGGPWVEDVIKSKIALQSKEGVRLVRGSHIVTRKLFDHGKCYFFQGTDGRIIFAIPYENDFTLIGTTDAEHASPDEKPQCTQEEEQYLLAFANQYFRQQLSAADIVWRYSGVRPLYDDGASSATAATRDYTLKVDAKDGAPVLHVFGGKITTYRRLAESALEKIGEHLAVEKPAWTATARLPGGDFEVGEFDSLVEKLRNSFSFLDAFWANRLVRAYGTDAWQIVDGAEKHEDLGRDFGATLTEAEVNWLIKNEYARNAEDVVWRRNKLGLRLSAEQINQLDSWMVERHEELSAAAE